MTDYNNYLQQILGNPAKLSDCYRMFHNYSFLNQFLAAMQLEQIEPINTYKGWQALGRQVKKGSKAIALRMPVTIKGETEEDNKTIFIMRNNWFAYSQTEGADYKPVLPEIKANLAAITEKLGLKLIPFKQISGNCQGYTCAEGIAINPVARFKAKTWLHEIAHNVLGHVVDGAIPAHDENLPKDIKEIEAETVAYIASNVLELATPESNEASAGYLRNWGLQNYDDKIAARIFSAVNKIINANKEV